MNGFYRNNCIIKYEGLTKQDNCVMLRGRIVDNKYDFYTKPLNSSILDEYESDGIL